jgi:hypothetical protein
MAFANHAAKGGTFRRIVGRHNLLHVVANTEVGPVHVTRNDEDHRDRQMVMGDVRQPQRLSLGMEAPQEGEDRSTRPFTGAKHMASSIRILGIGSPLPGKEGQEPIRVGRRGQEVIPAHMLTPRFGNGDVDQVTGPSQGADPKQPCQVVVQAGLRIFEPGQTGPEFGLEVQPPCKQEDRRQNQQEHGTAIEI